MSLSAAMHSAASGLSAVSRATGLVATNIANASTPGYAKRSLGLSSLGAGFSGVRVTGVIRHVSPVMVAQRREADAILAQSDIRQAFLDGLTQKVGGADDAFGLTARFADFEASLVAAASRPDLGERLDDAVAQASEMVEALRTSSDSIQQQRQNADQSIAVLVEDLNTGLARLQTINGQIAATASSGGDTAGLYDQRQIVLDEVNRIVPVTVVERPHGQIALYSEGGALLLDSQAATVEFTPTTMIQPHMKVENAMLSGLKINGVDIRTSSSRGQLRGGSLGAQFALRDEWAVDAQAQLDAVARDLVERFEDPAVDPTISAGDAGLFTDHQAPLDVLSETGLAGRLEVNARVDPSAGGDSWRLRDGLYATAPGEAGDSQVIQALQDTLAANRTPSSGSFGTGAQTSGSLVGALVSGYQQDLAHAEDSQSYASATQFELASAEMEGGVDTDAEMQSLMILEQNYAANAKVIETIDSLLSDLLRI